MPTIPFPNVPVAPGVPSVVRSAVTNPVTNIVLATVGSALLSALTGTQKWGIYDQSNNQLGISASSGLSITSLATALVTNSQTVLSTVSFDYTKETRVASFPIEGGGFATYNKVEMPGNPTVSLVLDGSQSDRTAFLAAIDGACKSTVLYNVATPEVTYSNYTLERYSYRRQANRGAILFVVEVSLVEVRQTSAVYTTTTQIVAPQSTDASSQVNSGMVQPTTPDTSTLKSMANALGIS